MSPAARKVEDRQKFRNEDLILRVKPHNPAKWDETRYEAFLDQLCGTREYQKAAIRTTLSYLLGERYTDLAQLAKENFNTNDDLRQRWGRWETLQQQLQLPNQLSCSLDLATGTGKSFVLYGIAAIMLAEGAVDRALVLCPSNTIEAGLLEKFRELAADSDLRDLLPADARVRAPHIANASGSIVDGTLCVENYHAILDHVNSSIRDSLKGKGERVIVLNDEAHHVANESGATPGRWKEFLQSAAYGFRYVVGVSGTCYVGNDYFSDVVFRYSLREAIEQRFVKKVEYVAEMPATHGQDEKWQLIWGRHSAWKRALKRRNIKPLTIIITQKIAACKQVAEELIERVSEWEGTGETRARQKVLVVTSSNEHQPNLADLRTVDSLVNPVEWIVSVSMLAEGWDVKNVFQIVPHEERAFNSKLLIAQVLGRGLRRPLDWTGEDPVVTVFNHDAWSDRIKHLVDEILEIERRLTSKMVESPYHFTLHNLDYERVPELTEYAKSGEYRLFESGFVTLPSQAVSRTATVEFEQAVTGLRSKFHATINEKTYSVEDVADRIYQQLRAIDEETAQLEAEEEHTNYAKKFPREKCEEIVRESLRQANISGDRITDDNRQKFLQALGTLRRKSAKRVVYVLAPTALKEINTSERQAESCSALELRRASKTIFFTDDSSSAIAVEQQEFFAEVEDPDGDYVSGRVKVENPADFKAPMSFVIADATPERKFVRELVDRRNASRIDGWIKNASANFYNIEYAWKKGEHPKRGEFSPDFFIKKGDRIFVVEIKDDGEISDPSPENIKKHEYASAHFQRLNEWLEARGVAIRYGFTMLSPRDYGLFFQKLQDEELEQFRSELDVVMMDSRKA